VFQLVLAALARLSPLLQATEIHRVTAGYRRYASSSANGASRLGGFMLWFVVMMVLLLVFS
jgi:hypothetical protein